MDKIAIILHAQPGTHDAMARAAHALLYTRELRESGIEVKLIFDGGGTMWLEELVKAENPLNGLYESVKKAGAISGVCQYCFGAFGGNEDGVREQGLPVDGEYIGHPSISVLVKSGYRIITL